MRIFIMTLGTQGDVQPYVSLGKKLLGAGHEVIICTCQKFEEFITSHRLKYGFVNNELIEFMQSDDGKIAMEQTGTLWETVRTAIRLLPKMGDMLERQVDDTWKAAQKFEPDLILFHPKSLGAKEFAEKLNVPCALGFYLPLFLSTGEFPAMGFPKIPLGKWYNRFTHWIIDSGTRWAMSKHLNKWRKENEVRPNRNKYLQKKNGELIPALYAYSKAVIPKPKEWPATATVTGYWFLDSEDAYQPPAELEQFLNEGPPPVYVGFGSIFGSNPERTTKTIIDAIELADVRAILAVGWGGLDISNIELPSSVMAIKNAPHDWLFPKVSAVVHHGGCGTTAAGLRAGRPTVICPFFGDQPFWGAKVAELGVGCKPIPQRHLTTEKLADALRLVTTDESIREKANQLGETIRNEKGPENAVHFIEQTFKCS